MGFLMSKFVLFYDLKQSSDYFFNTRFKHGKSYLIFKLQKVDYFFLLTKHDALAVAPYFYVALGEISHKYDKTCD